jgi:hypothetical protein
MERQPFLASLAVIDGVNPTDPHILDGASRSGIILDVILGTKIHEALGRGYPRVKLEITTVMS